MDLDQLQSVRDRERQTDKLQQLRDSFYEDATAYVRELRAERDRVASESADPFDTPAVNRLTDKIRTAERTIEAIYEKRVGKLVKAATFAAADLPAEADGMTDEEADLFETMVAEIQANRQRVLDPLTGEGEAGGDLDGGDGAGGPSGGAGEAAGSDQASSTGEGISAADVMRGDAPAEPQPPAGEDDGSDDPRTDGESAGRADRGDDTEDEADTAREDDGDVARELVRITDDVGAIFGVDEREYDLSTDDVVSLPAENAGALLERDAAERL